MWKIKELINFAKNNETNINGKWVPARPIDYKYHSIFKRLKHAWNVIVGKEETIVWENQ